MTAEKMAAQVDGGETDIDQLWADFKRTGEQELRNQLIIHYTQFARYVASRVMAGMPRHFEEEDLASFGIIGLIDAIDRFEPQRNLRFESYAMPRIKGAIVDELRSIDWVPRSVRNKARAVEQSHAHLERKLNRTPTSAEMAADLEMTAKEYQTILRKISFVRMATLDETFRNGQQSEHATLGDTLPDKTMSPVDELEAKESKEALAEMIEQMPEREKSVLTMYYYGGRTLAEIGELLGVTESRVCQIHTKVLRQLRAKMTDWSDAPAPKPRVTTVPRVKSAPALLTRQRQVRPVAAVAC